jgi:hypothetical protein
MNGPYSTGGCCESAAPFEWSWEKNRMNRGRKYRVVLPFVDADGDVHPVGEEWEFAASMFSRLDDQLTLCVRYRPDEEWRIPLLWTPESQQSVIEGFSDHVMEL